MSNFFRIIKPIVIILILVYVAFSLRHNYVRHHSHNVLQKTVIEKDSLLKEHSKQLEESNKWIEGYQERIQILEKELEECQNKK